MTCNDLPPFFFSVKYSSAAVSSLSTHPHSLGFYYQKLCPAKMWKRTDERKWCFVCQAAFVSLLLTHKHSQVRLSPRPAELDTEPDKDSHR